VNRIDWTTDAGALSAVEPTPAELAQHAAALSVGYNDPANATLMGHTSLLTALDVIESYTQSIADGMRAFLLFVDDKLAGDGDLRNFRGDTAEFAFMIAAPTAQGKGLGTKFATMIHTFGFSRLLLARIYASVVPQNTASRRVFEKLGYVVDHSPAGREYAEEPGDIVLVLERDAFRPPPGITIGER
jgi:RimJ/RimL family protein N-acetyltransferase